MCYIRYAFQPCSCIHFEIMECLLGFDSLQCSDIVCREAEYKGGRAPPLRIDVLLRGTHCQNDSCAGNKHIVDGGGETAKRLLNFVERDMVALGQRMVRWVTM